MMGIQDFHLSLPLTNTSSSTSSSPSCSSPLHPLSSSAEGWQVGEVITKQILSVIQPTSDSEKKRREIIKYLQTLVRDSFGIEVFPFGSTPLKTYLQHGDIDLTAVSHYDMNLDLAVAVHNLLQFEMTNNSKIQVRDVLYVPAQVKVVKCTVSNIAVDISFNQTAGLSALWLFEQVDQFIGNDHLFKRSVILLKAWCYYESRLLGGYHGLISTYALETLVLHVINHFHRSLHCPLAVLYKFLDYYSTFDWVRYCVAVTGLVSISSLPEITVQLPNESDEILLTDGFLRNHREVFLSSTEASGIKRPAFPVKFFNILDPLRDDNNLGRNVTKGNFHRIRSALSYGTEKLYQVLMLPPENMVKGFEKFFVNTLDRNGRGRRADVVVPMPEYSHGGSETSYAKEESGDLLCGIEYDLWFHDYGIVSPVDTSVTRLGGKEWVEIDQNRQFYQNMYSDVDETPPSSVDSTTSFKRTNANPPEEKWKSRGTGLYIPRLEHIIRSNIDLEGGRKEEKEAKEESIEEIETVDSGNSTPEGKFPGGDSSNVVNYSLEEFPFLPGSKPLSIKVSQSKSPKCEVNDTFITVGSFVLRNLKCLLPTSVTSSQSEEQSDSEVSSLPETINDPNLTARENQESSKSNEKMAVLNQPLLLRDKNEFPPLSLLRPAQPVIRFNKKEFPSLRAVLKSAKRGNHKKNFNEVFAKGETKEV